MQSTTLCLPKGGHRRPILFFRKGVITLRELRAPAEQLVASGPFATILDSLENFASNAAFFPAFSDPINGKWFWGEPQPIQQCFHGLHLVCSRRDITRFYYLYVTRRANLSEKMKKVLAKGRKPFFACKFRDFGWRIA